MLADRSVVKKTRQSEPVPEMQVAPENPPVFCVEALPFGNKPMTKADAIKSYKRVLKTYAPFKTQGDVNLSLNELSDAIDHHYDFLRAVVAECEADLEIIKDSILMMQDERRQADKDERAAIDEDIISEKKEYLDEYAKTVIPAKKALTGFKSDKRDFLVDFLNREFHKTDIR
jgi:hypothetical protein